MSKYNNLDARIELEQTIFQDIKNAFEKRGFQVRHNGTSGSHAPAGLPDIEIWNDKYHINVEVTKSKGAQQDRELNSISDHLNQIKNQFPNKKCYCIFVSPETPKRMLDGIKAYNRLKDAEEQQDLKILPLAFDTFEIYLTKLIESVADLYPITDLIGIFNEYNEFIDDLRIKKLLIERKFPEDRELFEKTEKEEVERDQKTLEKLIKDLAKLEDYMREKGIAVGHSAIDTLIYLVFMKLYEEKRELNGEKNRLSSAEAFDEYLKNSVSTRIKNQKKGIHSLFKTIKEEGEFILSGMFGNNDNLPETVTDDFIKEHIIPVLGEYKFIGTKIDALGAVYEVLALRAEKDVKVGQFFTPENIVKFMVKLAELDVHDYVLDPACGTGRFLISAMHDMFEKAKKSSARNKGELMRHIAKHQLFGADIDSRIAKIAKMNMWIHGDGKSNIFGGKEYNGLTLHKHRFNDHDTFDGAFDVVMTNPPLGELNYQVIDFGNDNDINYKLERIPFLPHKNKTKEKLEAIREKIETYESELRELEGEKAELEQNEIIQEFLIIPEKRADKEQKRKKKKLKNDAVVKDYLKISRKIKMKKKTIETNREKERELDSKIRRGNIEYEITGNTMKGGALFLGAIWHYLKDDAYPDNLPEWRGGKVLIILDEGILNTDDYKEVRKFIKKHFYIKAIISLTRDTFTPISKTSTKTSILYAVKKTDPLAKQKEPIFFTHVEKVGMDTKGKVIENDLDRILEEFFNFKKAIIESYNEAEFNRKKFIEVYGGKNVNSN